MTERARKILDGDLRAVARAATAVEDRHAGAEDLMRELFAHTGRALILGITGSPGAGKSTFADQLIRLLRADGKRVAVIAVDPTSPYTGGAILGDRIRMQSHHADDRVFIRSMATRGRLGGLAHTSMDLALLLDAAGFDVIVVETVGVGQDEVEIAQLADVTVVVLVPGMGDDVQAIKAGIMEIADVFVINKADQPGADRLQHEIQAMQSLSTRPDGWVPPIVRTVASEGQGMRDVLRAIEGFRSQRESGGVEAWRGRLREMLRERLLERVSMDELSAAAEAVAARRTDPYTVIHEWLERI